MARGDLAARMRSGAPIETPQAPSPAVSLAGADLAAQAEQAKRAPRSLAAFARRVDELLAYAPEDVETLIYAREHEGKMTRGASIRLAEMLLYAWGNARSVAVTTVIGRDYVEAEGVCLDLETNTATSITVRRSTRRDRYRMSHEAVLAAATAAGSIARRNAILACIPGMAWNRVLQKVEALIAGDEATLADRRSQLLDALVGQGIGLDRILAALEVENAEQIDRGLLVTLHGLAVSLRDGDADPEELFPERGERVIDLDGSEGFSPAFVAAELGAPVLTVGPGRPTEPQDDPPEVAESAADASESREAPSLSAEDEWACEIEAQILKAADEAQLDVVWTDNAGLIGELPLPLQLALQAHRVRRRRALFEQAPAPARLNEDRDETVDLFDERKVA